MLAALRRLGGPVEINPKPQETTWTTPLDEDEAHATYVPDQVTAYFAAATRAALVLTALRAPYRGRSTPVNAWWGSFDLAVSLFSGRPVEPPEADFITRNAGDAEQIEVGWWPGDARYPNAAFFAYAYPAPEGFAAATLAPRQRAGTPRWGVHPRLGRHPGPPGPARIRARVRPLGGRARLCGVPLGSGARPTAPGACLRPSSRRR